MSEEQEFLHFPIFGSQEDESPPPSEEEFVEDIGKSGLKKHYTLDVWDASRLQSFMDCPRGFFFTHVLGLRRMEPNKHLVFGSAWHEAMEHLINHGYSNAEIQIAHQKFLKIWRDYYPDPTIEESLNLYGKTPENALAALVEYTEAWKKDEYEVIMTEVAGAVPISETRMWHVKMDAILRFDDGVWAMEHKTTGSDKESWYKQWKIKLQVPGYYHGLQFISDKPNGIIVNGAILRSPKKRTGETNNKFVRLPQTFTGDMMAYWLWEVNHWFDLYEWNMEQLAETTPDDRIMYSFPRNGESCAKYGCKFGGLCSDWANPLRYCQHGGDLPPGYHQEFWDPRVLVEEASNELIVDPNSNETKIIKKPRKDGIKRTIQE